MAKVKSLLGSYLYFFHKFKQQNYDSLKSFSEELGKVKQRSDKIHKLQFILGKALEMPNINEKRIEILEEGYEMFAPNKGKHLHLLRTIEVIAKLNILLYIFGNIVE